MGDFSEVLSAVLKGLSVSQRQRGARMSWPNHCSAPWPHFEQQFVLCWHRLAFSVHGFLISPGIRDNPQPLPFKHTTYANSRMVLLAISLTFFFLFLIHLPRQTLPLTHTTSKVCPHFCFPLLGRRGEGWRARVFSSRTIYQGAGKWAGTQLRAAHWGGGVSLNEGPSKGMKSNE